MNPQSKTYGKLSERAFSDEAAGFVVPFSALDLPFSFNTMEKLENEVWKPIIGYETLYEVSNFGRVRSLNYANKKNKIQVLKNNICGRYVIVNLCKDKQKKAKSVHRLVYEAFVGEIPKFERKGRGHGDEMWVINHLDENPHNNNVENLELTTQTKNNNYGTRTRRAADAQRNKHGSKKVYQFTLEGELVKIWPSTAECGRNGFNEGHVAACCRGVNIGIYNNVFKGYIWSYKKTKNKKSKANSISSF